jgi:hypothetical protein
MLCYGHGDTSSNLVSVKVTIIIKIITLIIKNKCLYSSKVEQNTVNICIDVRVILKARLLKNSSI